MIYLFSFPFFLPFANRTLQTPETLQTSPKFGLRTDTHRERKIAIEKKKYRTQWNTWLNAIEKERTFAIVENTNFRNWKVKLWSTRTVSKFNFQILISLSHDVVLRLTCVEWNSSPSRRFKCNFSVPFRRRKSFGFVSTFVRSEVSRNPCETRVTRVFRVTERFYCIWKTRRVYKTAKGKISA